MPTFGGLAGRKPATCLVSVLKSRNGGAPCSVTDPHDTVARQGDQRSETCEMKSLVRMSARASTPATRVVWMGDDLNGLAGRCRSDSDVRA